MKLFTLNFKPSTPMKTTLFFSVLVILILLVAYRFLIEREYYTVLTEDQYKEKLAAYDDAYLIDVRTSFEHNRGYIKGATNIGFIGFSFSNEVDKLDRDKPVFLYCQTAHRSPFAAWKLHSMGFNQIFDLKGGFIEWENAGFEVVMDD